MIVSSLLILVIAAVLLVIGMITGNDQLLVSSISASLAAGIALYAGIRGRGAKRPRIASQRTGRTAADDDTQQFRRIGLDDTPTTELPLLEGKVFESTDYAVDRDPELRFEEPQRQGATSHRAPESLADEPTEQRMSSVEAAALMRLDTEVAVVDGRPRFHHTACAHLTGREHEPLPVAEALDLGFTPCGMCEPVSRLLMAPVGGR
ncbi:hypothetical protein SAMN05216298_0992 [Glycomyces sambucus]|uniref:Uncharacterized protein n=1 Tax=Glycomyces sambucus TaxID=380244 RepID=A0A1G9DMQ8_9ACTN|nr:hypothetical protein [Glycomyces sambucus]SDK65186.1 hypothetical protein SAMN05216298_0992 [Glycomyces sambucus]